MMGNDQLSPDSVFKSRDSGMSVKMNSQLLIGAVIFLFLMVIFTFFVYIYAKTYWLPRMTVRRRRAHFEFAAGDASVTTRGLDPGVLRSLPVTVFRRSEFSDGLECSVCLCELSEGEEARLLPKCSHGFHLQCIDMWFHSHSTCPLCRCNAGPEASFSGETDPPATASPASEHPLLSESQIFSINRGRVSAGGFSGHPDRSLVIAVPNRIDEGFNLTPLGTMSSPAEVARSPGMSKFTALRRLLSRGRSNGSSSSCSGPIECDIEQGRDGAINGERSSVRIIETNGD